MTATTHNTAPSRSSLRRTGTVTRWGSRHLRVVGSVHIAVGVVLTALGAVLLPRGGTCALVALPLAIVAAVHFAWGSRQLVLARSAAHRTGV